MTNTSISKVVASAAMALICILVVQSYWLKNTFDHSTRTFDERVRISLRNVADALSAISQVQLPSYRLITQITQDYYVVNIRDAIDANSLEYYLIKEFEAVSLHTDFEYGIYDCANDQMVYGNYIAGRDGTKTSTRSSNLPTYDEFVYYFGVRFPDRNGYILNNMWLPLLFTGILLLAILFFGYATYEILRQKKLSELQKDFINNMTHEFKTPLSSIEISAQVFLSDGNVQKDRRLRRYAQIIHSQAKRLNDQVERVLEIAGYSKKGMDLELETVDLHQVMNDVAEQLKSRLDQKEATLAIDFRAADHMIKADMMHLSNVLFNLLDNALKYSQQRPNIVMATHQRDKKIILEVKDHGVGIPQRYLHKLGEKFFRVPTGDIHNAKGFGLGLHYVTKVVKAHGWKMQVHSALKKGTTVEISIDHE